MKQNITEKVVRCRVCRSYFTLGIEGDGDTCDICAYSDGDSQYIPGIIADAERDDRELSDGDL